MYMDPYMHVKPTYNHNAEFKTFLHRFPVSEKWQVMETER